MSIMWNQTCEIVNQSEIKKTDIGELDTIYIKDIISRCEDIEDLKHQIFPLLKSQQDQWKDKINEIITENRYNKMSFANACRVSRVTVDKWCKGSIPKNRETFLRIGMAAQYNRQQMDQLLTRYGQYPKLYPKSLEDCVYIYVINKYAETEALREYDLILERIRNRINEGLEKEEKVVEDTSTVLVNEKLLEVQDEDDLEKFIAENATAFASAYYKFYAYVKMCVRANYQGYAGSVFELAESQEWSSSLRQCVSAIRQNKWYPTRNKIISLGLHLSMDHDQIDEMLELAHMEPLCAKNIFESVVMFILDDASLNNMLDTQSEDYDPDELCRYARDVLKELDLPEIAAFINELPETDNE